MGVGPRRRIRCLTPFVKGFPGANALPDLLGRSVPTWWEPFSTLLNNNKGVGAISSALWGKRSLSIFLARKVLITLAQEGGVKAYQKVAQRSKKIRIWQIFICIPCFKCYIRT